MRLRFREIVCVSIEPSEDIAGYIRFSGPHRGDWNHYAGYVTVLFSGFAADVQEFGGRVNVWARGATSDFDEARKHLGPTEDAWMRTLCFLGRIADELVSIHRSAIRALAAHLLKVPEIDGATACGIGKAADPLLGEDFDIYAAWLAVQRNPAATDELAKVKSMLALVRLEAGRRDEEGFLLARDGR